MHWHCGQGRVLLGKLLLVSTSINPFFQPSFSYLQPKSQLDSTRFLRFSWHSTFSQLKTRRTSLAMWRRRPVSPFAESIPRVGASQPMWDLQKIYMIYIHVCKHVRASILADIVFDKCYMLLYAYINLLVEEERTTWPCIYEKWCRIPTCLMSRTVP